MLRKVLFARFLGLYVPPIPEKKATGNTEAPFVEERMFYLNKFMKDIAQLPYLYESEEFALFLRPPTADIDQAFMQLPLLTSDKLLARLREVMPLQETNDEFRIKHLNENVLNAFIKECSGLQQALNAFKI